MLPDALGRSIADETAAVHLRDLRLAAGRLSARYRDAGSAGHLPPLDDLERLAYLRVRLPATYAVAARVLREVPCAPPGGEAAGLSLLDLGAGPGTLLHAAVETIGGLARAVLVERDPALVAIGRRLASPLSVESSWITGDWSATPADSRFDLVTASFLLAEIDPRERTRLVDRAWEAAASAVVLIEPGTPAGHARIVEARRQLIARGAAVLAPCPHEAPCPIAQPDWCHFAVRLARTRDHRLLKGGDLPYEDEKYAFVIAGRKGSDSRGARVLRRPHLGPRQVGLRLCTPSGLVERTVFKSDREAYRAARHVAWGDRWGG